MEDMRRPYYQDNAVFKSIHVWIVFTQDSSTYDMPFNTTHKYYLAEKYTLQRTLFSGQVFKVPMDSWSSSSYWAVLYFSSPSLPNQTALRDPFLEIIKSYGDDLSNIRAWLPVKTYSETIYCIQETSLYIEWEWASNLFFALLDGCYNFRSQKAQRKRVERCFWCNWKFMNVSKQNSQPLESCCSS